MEKIRCKECLELKRISDYYLYNWKTPFWRCKECVKRWRKSEKERKMARSYDKKRSKDPNRIAYVTSNTKRYRKENPEKWDAHKIVNNYFRTHKEEKPNTCSKCGFIWKWRWQIELHHEDYNKPREVIPLCSLCHKWYHKWVIEIDLNKVLKF